MGIENILIVTAAIGAISSCGSDDRITIEDEGPRTEITRSVGDFEEITVAGPFRVTVADGAPSALTIAGPENVMEYLETEVDKGELTIRMKKGVKAKWRWNDENAVTVNLSHNALSAASIAGSGTLDIARVAGDRFEGAIAGSGDMSIAQVDSAIADFAIAGSGDLSAAGKVEELDLDIAGSGNFDGRGLEAQRADISIAGSGDVDAMATDTADVSVAGSGDVTITGGAKCSVSKMGSGDVTCG